MTLLWEFSAFRAQKPLYFGRHHQLVDLVVTTTLIYSVENVERYGRHHSPMPVEAGDDTPLSCPVST